MNPAPDLRVLIAPDWRGHNPYLRELESALSHKNIAVEFPHGTRRGLPITRLTKDQPGDILHLHWPEAFWPAPGALHRNMQMWRFPLDLKLARQKRAIVYTAHNLFPHDQPAEGLVRRATLALLKTADAVIAHSENAGRALMDVDPSLVSRLHIIPHGDLLADSRAPDNQAARRALGHTTDCKVVLMFGVIQPYKGIEQIIGQWSSMPNDWCLRIVGPANNADHVNRLKALATASGARVDLRIERLTDTALGEEIAAADATLFNYSRVFTSGAACLARSIGTPVVLPSACTTIDLSEPTSTVFRFGGVADDLKTALSRALSSPRNPSGATEWRRQTSWSRVAELTIGAYRSAIKRTP